MANVGISSLECWHFKFGPLKTSPCTAKRGDGTGEGENLSGGRKNSTQHIKMYVSFIGSMLTKDAPGDYPLSTAHAAAHTASHTATHDATHTCNAHCNTHPAA